jgi:acyl-coenzyme A synthetase/AMP-(fatty) acid ligase
MGKLFLREPLSKQRPYFSPRRRIEKVGLDPNRGAGACIEFISRFQTLDRLTQPAYPVARLFRTTIHLLYKDPMKTASNTPEGDILRSLLAGPKQPRRNFLVDGVTFGQLYGHAEAIGRRIRNLPDTTRPLCLCVEDRGLVTAALLAALMVGTPLLIPYAFDAHTLNEAREGMPFSHALVEKPDALPDGVTALSWPLSEKTSKQTTPPTPLAWDEPWLYLFTGGSTGTPKLWSKTPRNLLMEAVNLADTFRVTPQDTIAATVPSNHIYGLLYAVLLPLVSGAAVDAATPSFPHEIADCLAKTRATILVSIPAHYRALKETRIEKHRVRLAFSSAGALPEQDAVRFHETTGIAVTEIYGSTETGGIAQRTRAKGQTSLHPFECTRVRIEERHLAVSSPFLSDELPKSDGGYFETADRARWTDGTDQTEPGGFILLGRSDGIVKVGGKRVDLALTKEALMSVDGVRDVYVYARPVQSGRENEILALVEGRTTTDQLMEAAHRRLPTYARPRHIKITPKITLTATGKYRRAAIASLFEPKK